MTGTYDIYGGARQSIGRAGHMLLQRVGSQQLVKSCAGCRVALGIDIHIPGYRYRSAVASPHVLQLLLILLLLLRTAGRALGRGGPGQVHRSCVRPTLVRNSTMSFAGPESTSPSVGSGPQSRLRVVM